MCTTTKDGLFLWTPRSLGLNFELLNNIYVGWDKVKLFINFKKTRTHERTRFHRHRCRSKCFHFGPFLKKIIHWKVTKNTKQKFLPGNPKLVSVRCFHRPAELLNLGLTPHVLIQQNKKAIANLFFIFKFGWHHSCKHARTPFYKDKKQSYDTFGIFAKSKTICVLSTKKKIKLPVDIGM